MIPRPENPLIAALDVPDLGSAEDLARRLGSTVGLLKVGLTLLMSHGPSSVELVARHGPVFVDAKLHDIPHQVEGAAEAIGRLGAAMLTVHALGGAAMVAAGVAGAERGAARAGVPVPLVLAVTVLSSQSGEEFASPASLAFEAKSAGAGGVVVSGGDVREVREACGEDFCLVVPGIRPPGSNGNDQLRVLTPEEAVDAGADYLVLGRPITGASDPAGAARSILATVR